MTGDRIIALLSSPELIPVILACLVLVICVVNIVRLLLRDQ